MDDLKRAFDALKAKLLGYDTAFAYASGNQPLQYSTQRLKDAFRDLTTSFSQNWVSVVLNSVLDRMKFIGWSVKDTTQNDRLAEIFNSQQIAIEGYDADKGALVTSEAFIVAWKEEDGIEVYYNDPLCAIYFMMQTIRRKKSSPPSGIRTLRMFIT